jgi:hypothetical protein
VPNEHIDGKAQERVLAHLEALDAYNSAVAAGEPTTDLGLPQGPATVPCQKCQEPWWVHPGPKHSGRCPNGGPRARYAEDLIWLRVWQVLEAHQETLGQAVRRQMADERAARRQPHEPGKWGVGPSDLGNCDRKVWYREMLRAGTPPEGFRPDDSWDGEAVSGSLLHRAITDLLKARYPWRRFDVPVVLRTLGLDTKNSEADSADPMTGRVTDYKTAGSARWDMIGPEGPEEDTWGQVLVYGLALAEQGMTVREVELIYWNREHGQSESFVRPYDRDAAVAALERLTDMTTALDLGHVLDRPPDRTGPTNDPLCGRCFARSHCWSIPQAKQAGRSPESYTILGAEPEDPTVEQAAVVEYEARRRAKDAKDQHKAAQVLLDGIPPRQYGGMVIKPARSGPPNIWPRYRALETAYSLPDGERPPMSALPPVEQTGGTRMSAEPVRAAKRARAATEALPPAPPSADGQPSTSPDIPKDQP